VGVRRLQVLDDGAELLALTPSQIATLGRELKEIRRTREIVKRLTPDEIKQKVDAARLRRVLEEGAVVKEAQGLLDYWGKRTIAGLLLMPATRHPFVHLNEMARIKQKCKELPA